MKTRNNLKLVYRDLINNINLFKLRTFSIKQA